MNTTQIVNTSHNNIQLYSEHKQEREVSLGDSTVGTVPPLVENERKATSNGNDDNTCSDSDDNNTYTEKTCPSLEDIITKDSNDEEGRK
mmetsp:Transcript_40719/g.44178  ORF Transcript_40719/g.44178 Transcript_40719/m.44178 type:complete len:89 (+) Transcript_40719:400-666(+)